MATRNINDLIATQKVANASYTLENGQIILTTGTITTSKPAVSATQTWNDAGVTFTGIKLNVTDTASASGSLLLDLQVGGGSIFAVGKTSAGAIHLNKSAASGASISVGSTGFHTLAIHGSAISSATFAVRDGVGVTVRSSGGYHWVSDTNAGSGTVDLSLLRDAANTLAQRNAANAQAFHLYGTFTDASNYRRLLIGSTTAGVFSITPVGAGTGAAGNVLHISGLPTSNPGAGILWNNAGNPAIGT